MSAVVLLSGGLDSTTLLAQVAQRGRIVHAITFRYGQRHQLETKFARKLARRFGITKHKVISLGFYRQLTSNALMSQDGRISRSAGKSCPNTVVEGRNAFFLLSASVWAKELGADEIYTGVGEADYSGYPDCREVFVKAQQRAIRLALEWPIRIVTPFMHMSKADEWRLAEKLGIRDIIENETLTCYNGISGRGCGRCPACRLRNRGYREAFG
jgi:7-cyano-7-deazaguanine synthase